MRNLSAHVVVLLIGSVSLCAGAGWAAPAAPPSAPEQLVFHTIRTDTAGKIVPWESDDLGRAYDHTVRVLWRFWDGMAADRNGLPYFMNHQVWTPALDDHRGLGGDQIAMALSSWQLLYQYAGDATNPRHDPNSRDRIIENMKFMADWVLSHGLSSPKAAWPNLPYPYNTLIYSGVYDGDMILGKDFTQPDKAGSFGAEIVKLWKITGNRRYLAATIAMADTLAAKTRAGDDKESPLPFKVNAETGDVGVLRKKGGDVKSSYSSNWAGTLQLFTSLAALDPALVSPARATAYRKAAALITAWMRKVPLSSNKWGPFFEDIPGWSDTQINAVTFANFMMDNPALFPDWQKLARSALDWAWQELGNHEWEKYGVVVVNEQTAYRVPGNSHTARQAATELRYAELTGDTSHKANAIRALSWTTYSVDKDGRNQYPRDDIWLTDGYGDYVRHILRAMAAAPELAPSDQDHVLRSSSIVTRITYTRAAVAYATFDVEANELVRLVTKPKAIFVGDGGNTLGQGGAFSPLPETAANADGPGWSWQPMEKGGVARIRRDRHREVRIDK